MQPVWKIVAPLDLRQDSEPFVEHALQLASATGSELILLSVMADRLFRRGRRLAWPPNAFATTCDIHRIVIPGHPAEAIVRYANLVKADMLFMCSRSHSGWRSLVKRSVTAEVARKMDRPMWIMDGRRPQPELEWKSPVILCVMSLDESDNAILRMAESLAEPSRGQLILLHVIGERSERPSRTAASSRPVLPGDAVQHLRECAAGLNVPWKITTVAGPLRTCISEAAEESGAALIVAARPVPGRADLVPMIGRFPCPVLSLPMSSSNVSASGRSEVLTNIGHR